MITTDLKSKGPQLTGSLVKIKHWLSHCYLCLIITDIFFPEPEILLIETLTLITSTSLKLESNENKYLIS